ncbi:MAG TPA: ThuA domain-containing protein [Luteolibacter sp.]|nr:ThuA domain-containing protein [Luteolibacter sp.]
MDYHEGMKLRTFATLAIAFATLGIANAETKPLKILFFSKSSGFEHSVISWSKGQPSHAEKVLEEIGKQQGWTFEFSKDGSKFTKEYLAGFNAVMFYTTGDLTTAGKDKHPPMTAQGKQDLLDYVRGGGGFIGLHCASDTFHTQPAGDKYTNHEKCDDYICMLGGEFITHGKQQEATNRIINPKFPGLESANPFRLHEEWYALKNFNPDIHALTVMDTAGMEGEMYKRPPFPTIWARMEGKGRVYYNAMGHREDIWTHELFKGMLVGAVKWTSGQVNVEIPANLKQVAPEATINIQR